MLSMHTGLCFEEVPTYMFMGKEHLLLAAVDVRSADGFERRVRPVYLQQKDSRRFYGRF